MTPEGDTDTMPATAKKTTAARKAAPKKKAAAPKTKRAASPVAASAPARMEPGMMSDLLRAIHDKANEIDTIRESLEALITESDELIREAVDEGERYRDIAAAAGRTVPWVQMSLRRAAGVSTHPAAPIPDARIRKTPRRAAS